MQVNLAGSMQTNPTFWLNPKNGVSYPIVVQTPQYWIDSLSDLANLQVDGKHGVMPLGGGLHDHAHTTTPAVVSHYNVQPVIDIYATTHDRDLGAVAGDIQKILDDTAKEVPGGSTVKLRGAGHDDDRRLRPALRRPRPGDRADLHADRRELSILDRSVRDRQRAAGRARRHRLDALHHPHHAFGAGLDGSDHVHGRRHRQFDPRRLLRSREDG